MKRNDGLTTPANHGVMTFEDIGKELGITRGAAWKSYKKAMYKLRRKDYRERVNVLRQLVELKAR